MSNVDMTFGVLVKIFLMNYIEAGIKGVPLYTKNSILPGKNPYFVWIYKIHTTLLDSHILFFYLIASIEGE